MQKQRGEIYCIPENSSERYEPSRDGDSHLSHYHSFVITGVNEHGYTAHMLTHSKRSDNELMSAKHFKPIIAGFGFRFSNSRFLKQQLIKTPELDVKKIGDLTEEGLKFIDTYKIGPPIAWAEFISS